MTETLTPNTQAILLLTAPLISVHSESSVDLLTLGEYNKLARILREKQKQPSDLIGPHSENLIELCAQTFGRERLDALLCRGFLLSQAVEKWNARAIWVISRADSLYPKRLKTRLKEDAPPLLFGCGNSALLENGGFAVVGSRHVDDELVAFTQNVGRLAAQAHRTIVSGGAKGIDRAAMHGALLEGGSVAGVMADSLERAALASDNREALMDGRLVLVSPYDPAAGFNVGNAMQRNKVIYALSDAGLVVTADFEKGGTWAGAMEQLERFHFVPVFVRNGPGVGRGNAALIHQGGHLWPNPENAAEFCKVITAAVASAPRPVQETLSLAFREQPGAFTSSDQPEPPGPISEQPDVLESPSGALLKTVSAILRRELVDGKTEEQVMSLLGITKAQAKTWLATLLKKGEIEKVSDTQPVQYRTSNRYKPIP